MTVSRVTTPQIPLPARIGSNAAPDELQEEGWNLIKELSALSHSKKWAECRKEWEIDRIEYLEGPYETCICGHYPIKEVCHIFNSVTHKEAIVGNRCIQKLEGNIDEAWSTKKIFAAFKRIQKNKLASANKELIEYAYHKWTLSDKDYTFYMDIWRKRDLSEPQENYKRNLNDKMIALINGTQIVTSLHLAQASQRPIEVLRENPSGIADLSLIEWAYRKERISQRDHEFYRDFIEKRFSPSPTQKQWICDINSRILGESKKRHRDEP